MNNQMMNSQKDHLQVVSDHVVNKINPCHRRAQSVQSVEHYHQIIKLMNNLEPLIIQICRSSVQK
ncbi:hypothetical protein BpHYR1_029042 [Brachionus plicatilis]|uniref:Uncharacterized protein n=1 Tax=Brachionus plicatilis TaxID=10195 RepID=A0A3M7PWH4_BRAPC|nr:hypothetical protein BpHYR1_029042 [Brachionus plicatilis]